MDALDNTVTKRSSNLCIGIVSANVKSKRT